MAYFGQRLHALGRGRAYNKKRKRRNLKGNLREGRKKPGKKMSDPTRSLPESKKKKGKRILHESQEAGK